MVRGYCRVRLMVRGYCSVRVRVRFRSYCRLSLGVIVG